MEKAGVADFALKNLKGEDIRLSDFKGKVVILNFWASWCDPCVEEFPSLMKLVDRFNGEVVLVAVSADRERGELDNFLQTFKAVDHPGVVVLWDQSLEIAKSFGTVTLPETYIIDRDMKLVRKVVGIEDWASEMAVHFFEQLVELK